MFDTCRPAAWRAFIDERALGGSPVSAECAQYVAQLERRKAQQRSGELPAVLQLALEAAGLAERAHNAAVRAMVDGYPANLCAPGHRRVAARHEGAAYGYAFRAAEIAYDLGARTPAGPAGCHTVFKPV